MRQDQGYRSKEPFWKWMTSFWKWFLAAFVVGAILARIVQRVSE